MSEAQENLICFTHVIDLKNNHDPEAWDRILDKFIEAVEAEGGLAGGGVHALGSNRLCQSCQDYSGSPVVCLDCGKEVPDDRA